MAAFFWIGLGANTNWSTVNNWSATSGGVTNAATPSVTSDVTFDGVGVSGNTASVVSATQSVLSLTFSSGYTQSVTVNAALTIAGNFTDNTAHTWAGASAMIISATSTITSGGKTWPNAVQFTNANTKTLSGDWTITGTLTISAATTINSGNLNIGGGLTNSIGTTGGTTVLVLNGTGTWAGSQILQNSVTINTAGTITLGSGGIAYNTGTITYTAGTIVNTSNILTVSGSTTFNTGAMAWNNITISANATITLNSLLTVTGTFTINTAVVTTFAGSFGFTVGTLTCSHAGAATQTFKNSVTYTITTAFNAFLSRNGSILLFTSDDGTLKATLTLNNGATCNVLASFTRIDASNGRAIWTFNGTVTTCFNIIALTDLSFVTGTPKIIQGNSNY